MSFGDMKRRDVLKLAVQGAAGGWLAGFGAHPACAQSSSGPAGSASAAALAPSSGFDAMAVSDMARALAAKPYRAPSPPPLGNLASISAEEYAAIRARPDANAWAGEQVAFVVEPIHRGFRFAGSLDINFVEAGAERRLEYDPGQFDFGTLKPPAASARIGYSGMAVHGRAPDGTLREVLRIQDASFLAAVALDQDWGLVARPLTVRTPDQKAEESPQIRALWIEKPEPASDVLVFHALLDTPSLAAAVRFTLRTGEATIIDTECAVFTRAVIEHFGLATMQATYFLGELEPRANDDVRRAAAEISGLQMLTGKGEWIWRPVTNRRSLQISAFVDHNPRGFGLLQRRRDFSDFEDDDTPWQLRPSLWIEPIGEWRHGEVTLLELPAGSQLNKNIACYWRPRPGLAARAENHFAFRQFWCWRPPDRPDGAVAVEARIGRIPGTQADGRRRFLIEFRGESLMHPGRLDAVEPQVWTSSGRVANVRVHRTASLGRARVLFDFEHDANQPLVELRLLLESRGEPISETWLYRWIP
jgi:glucans biosynthesis protein